MSLHHGPARKGPPSAHERIPLLVLLVTTLLAAASVSGVIGAAPSQLDAAHAIAHGAASNPGLPGFGPGAIPLQAPGDGNEPGADPGSDATPAPPVVAVQLEVIVKTIDVLGVPTEVWTYGGTVPGTIIRVTEGTSIEVTLVNGHSQTHSIHTHLRGNLIASDGSSDTAPLPIVPHQHNPLPVEANPIGPYDPRPDRDVADPGQSYTYTFFADTPGNFLYHCHVFLATDHIERGLFGMFVVYPKGWTWEELPVDPVNGNTKARVTDAQGHSYFEDVIMMSELSPVASPVSPPAAPAGAPLTSEYPSSVPTSGFTPAATGKFHLANYRAWNDPYVVGPVQPNERVIMRVANIGDEMHDWHVHSHWFDVIDKTSRDWKPLFTDDTYLLGPGDSIMTMLTAGNPGHWFMHDHIVPQAYVGMVPWFWIDGEPVPNVPPTVFIERPIDGAVVAGRVLVEGDANDFEGRELVRSVEIRIDGGAWEPVTGLLQWRYEWDTTLVADGVHELSLRSFDGRNHSAETAIGVIVHNAFWASSGATGTSSAAAQDATRVAESSSAGLLIVALAAGVVAWLGLRRRTQ